MIAKGLINLLVSHGPVNDLAGDRVYPCVIPPDGSGPCLVLSRTSTEMPDGLDDEGDTAESYGPDEARFRLECWATRYEDADALAFAASQLLRKHKGTLGTSGQSCKWTRVEDWRDEPVYPDDDEGGGVYCSVVDVLVCYDPAEL